MPLAMMAQLTIPPKMLTRIASTCCERERKQESGAVKAGSKALFRARTFKSVRVGKTKNCKHFTRTFSAVAGGFCAEDVGLNRLLVPDGRFPSGTKRSTASRKKTLCNVFSRRRSAMFGSRKQALPLQSLKVVAARTRSDTNESRLLCNLRAQLFGG